MKMTLTFKIQRGATYPLPTTSLVMINALDDIFSYTFISILYHNSITIVRMLYYTGVCLWN